MLKKSALATTLLLVIIVALSSGAKASTPTPWGPPIKIGIFAPMDPNLPYWYAGYHPAAEMIAEQINDTGGIYYGGEYHPIVLGYAHEPYNFTPGWEQITRDSIDYLALDFRADFIIGGFRSECVLVALDELLLLNQSGVTVPFFIDGCLAEDLLNQTVGQDHEAYKHLWRVMPPSVFFNFSIIEYALKYYLCSDIGFLTRLFGVELWPGGPKQVKTAVVMEGLDWNLPIWESWTNPEVYPDLLGQHVNVTYTCRLPPDANPSQIHSVIQNIIDANCSLLLHVFSIDAGVEFIVIWHDMHAPCLPVGINKLLENPQAWNWTNGKCEYESIAMIGTTPEFYEFVDNFRGWTLQHLGTALDPVYTAFGVHIAMNLLKSVTETLGTLDPEAIHNYICPRTNPNFVFDSILGPLKFTENHDAVISVNAYIHQWLDGYLPVVYPPGTPGAWPWCLPPWMYTLIWDVNYDGKVLIWDIVYVADHFGTRPRHPRWDHRCDVAPRNWTTCQMGNDIIGIDDVVAVAMHFGEIWTVPEDP